MSELVPGTPEYQEAYDKEMQRLEAEANKDTPVKAASDATIPSEEEVEAKANLKITDVETIKTETPEELKQRIDTLEKRQKETQAWGTRNAQELARIKQERESDKHDSQRPAFLDANPGLEDAIKHVSVRPERQKPPQEQWLDTVVQVIPDVEGLLSDPGFYKKAEAKKLELGPDWNNPLIAIRELSELKVAHKSEKAAQGAVESARKDFEVKAKKRNAMEVPGGSGGQSSAKSEDEAKKMWDMPQAEFEKMRAKTLGYS